jgi:hypothetical protein
MDGEVADQKGLFGKRADLEMQKGKLAEMATCQRLNIPFIEINWNPAFFQEAEGGILDMVAMQVGNDRAVNFGKISI